MSEKFSISPGGEKFPLPKPEDYKNEFENLEKRIEEETCIKVVKLLLLWALDLSGR